jgi:hypothetical protein
VVVVVRVLLVRLQLALLVLELTELEAQELQAVLQELQRLTLVVEAVVGKPPILLL